MWQLNYLFNVMTAFKFYKSQQKLVLFSFTNVQVRSKSVFAYMSSQSDQEHSSSSPVEGPTYRRDHQNRSRSRSRDKHRRRYENNESRSKLGKKKHVIKVPDFSNELISFRTFLLNQSTQNLSKEKAEKQYEAYKQKWEQKNSQAFFLEHKQDAWFQERYNPEVLDAIERERKANIINAAANFSSDFLQGKYDGVNLSIEDPNKLGFICNDREDEDQLRQILGDSSQNSGVPVHLQTYDINASSNLNLNGPPFYGFDPDSFTLFIKAIPRNISKFDILQIVGNLEGFMNITLSEPVKKFSFARYCWITFKDQQCLKKAENTMNGITIKGEPLVFGRSSYKTKRRIKVLKNYPISRLGIDAQICKNLVARLDTDLQIKQNPILNAQFSTDRKLLDTMLLYLRKVHAYDYYTSTFYYNQRSLCLKLGLVYLRAQANYEEQPHIQTVFKKFQQSAESIIKNGLNIQDYFKTLRDELEKVVTKIIADNQGISIQQASEKTSWNCLNCTKRFKTCEFLVKHIIAKHNQIKDKKIEEMMEKSYFKDPKKLTNFSSNREDRDPNKNKRPGYKRDRKKEYKDLDEPDLPQYEKSAGNKRIVNFLDI